MLAVAAKPAQVHDLLMHFEAVRGRGGREPLGKVIARYFERVAAAFADEELALMRLAYFAARNERIARFDAVHETVLDEKIECTVDRRGRDAATLGLERGDQIIGTDRLAGGRDKGVDLATQLRKRQTMLRRIRVGA